MSIRYLFSFFLLFFFLDCNRSQAPLLKKLPDAEYPKSNPIDYGFGDWFAIRLNNDSMSCGIAKTYHAITTFDELEIILCEEFSKRNHAEFNKDQEEERLFRTLILEIDSSTRYGLFDHTVELLRHKNLQKFYIRTRDAHDKICGFSVVFPETQELLKPYLVRLYGEKIISKYNFFQDCLGEKPPPPPPGIPPPPPLPDSLRFLTPVDKLKSVVKTGNFGKNVLIEMQNDQLYLNKERAEFRDLIKAVQQPKSDYEFFIMLGEKNNYGDLIKILDLLYVSREKLNNTIAQKLYGLDYAKLDRYQKSNVHQEEPFMWLIVTLSEQLYINAN